MSRKKFEKLMMKNTLAVVVPIMAVLIALIILSVRYSFFHQLRSYEIGNIERVDERLVQLYESKTTSVKYVAKNLYYTGYNYYVDGKVKGAYYYSIYDNYMLFFLVKTTDPVMFIEEKALKGRIIKDTVVTEHMMAGLTETSELDLSLFEGFVGPYVISEPDYPYVYASIVYIVVAAFVGICVLLMCYVSFLWTHPSRHPQARQLRAYGRRVTIIKELDEELSNHLLYKLHGVYVTEKYLVASYLFKTDVIRLDDVRYLSKNRVEKSNGREIYRLTLAEPDTDLFYELDFKCEPEIDDVVEAIRGSES